ncbi:MAG: hypothetical protein AAFV38_05035 [Pseudomonadota bacterium]
MPQLFLGTVLLLLIATALPAAAFCEAPAPPPLTSEALAREYRDELKAEFEKYFSDAQSYLRCSEDERRAVLETLEDTAQRYDRFLGESQEWERSSEYGR